jgi:hypothetical protein
VIRYIENVAAEKSIIKVVTNVFMMEKKIYRGVTEPELEKILAREPNGEVRRMLMEITLVGDGFTSLKAGRLRSGKMIKDMTIFAKRSNEKYDIVVATASQSKEIDSQKVVVAFGVAAALGGAAYSVVMGVCLYNPALLAVQGACPAAAHALAAKVALGVGGIAIGGAAVKAAMDYNEALDDHVTGYMAQKLIEEGIFTIKNNQLLLK